MQLPKIRRQLFTGKPYVHAFDGPAQGPISQPWTVELFLLGTFLCALCLGMAMVYDPAVDDINRAQAEQLAKAERAVLQQRAELGRTYERGLAAGVRATTVPPEGTALAQACRVAGLGMQP